VSYSQREHEPDRRKADLRARMRALRAAIPEGERRRLAQSVADRLFSLPTVAAARTVMVFASFGSEVPTDGIVARLNADGVTVLLPFIQEGELRASRFRPGDRMIATTYGPGEPEGREAVNPADIDVVVTPGLAFDRRGHRLGYGGAYYDRYLPLLGSRALRVGIAFHQQLVDDVPAGDHDAPVDVVVTDREVVVCRSQGQDRDRP
jgi:5-formyltetrahydrofolate cyclo-ligase